MEQMTAADFDHHTRAAFTEQLRGTARGRSLGRLAEVASWIAGAQSAAPPHVLDDVHAIAIPGVHGCADRDVAGARATETTATDVENWTNELRSHSGPIAGAVRAAGAHLQLIDEWTATPAGSIDAADAMDEATYDRAVEIGASAADTAIDSGAQALIPLTFGSASAVTAAALMGALTRTEPVAIVGTGPTAARDDAAWKATVTIIRDAMFRARFASPATANSPEAGNAPGAGNTPGAGQTPGPTHSTPADLLRRVGSPEIVALMALTARAAARRTPVIVDGMVTTTAAVFADRLHRGCADWVLATGSSHDPAHRIAIRELGVSPLLELDVRADLDIGALLALPMINTAIETASALSSD